MIEKDKALECFEFIKKFSSVKVEHVLKELKIDKSNFYNFKCKKSDYIKVKKHLISELAKIFVIEDDKK